MEMVSLPSQLKVGLYVGVIVEFWSDGVLEYWSVGPFHYSTTPLFQSSKVLIAHYSILPIFHPSGR